MEDLVYTGVGSQSTADEICKVFTYLGAELGCRGWRLRSGHASGPDISFEDGSPKLLGVDAHMGRLGREIFLPWRKFNGRRQSYDPFNPDTTSEEDDEGYYVPDAHWPTYEKAAEIAESVIPYWDNLKPSHKRLHTRNVYQVLGKRLDQPSQAVICNAALDGKGEPKGGTRTAIKIAELYNVPVFNRQKYENDDDFIEAVLDFVINKEMGTYDTDNHTESQKPTTPKVDAADAADGGVVVGSTETPTKTGTDPAEGKGSAKAD